MKETNHDYQNCLVGNHYDRDMTGQHNSWYEFKKNWVGFEESSYDDTYHFIFRYDIHLQEDGAYTLELCSMLQRKGIYVHIYVYNISQHQLDNQVAPWLEGRRDYIRQLWDMPLDKSKENQKDGL